MNKYGWFAAWLSLAIGVVEAAPMDSTDILHDQLAALDGEVRAVADTGATAPLKLLQERHDVVERLSTFGLQAVDALRLTATERARLVAAQPAAGELIEDDVTVTGQSQRFVADDFAHRRSATRWRILTSDGRYELFFGPQGAPSGLAAGATLKITGLRIGHNIAVSSAAVARPSQTEAEAATNAPASCSTKGPQSTAVLLMTTPSNPSYPPGWNAAFFEQSFFGTTGLGLNTFLEQASYGQTSATGAVFGPFALAQDYTCGVNDEQLMTDSVAAAASTVNFGQYNRIAIVFPVQSCTYGGLGSIGCGTGLISGQSVSEAWFPIFSFQQTDEFISISAHEFGHNLGLNHSNSDDYGPIPLGPIDQPGLSTEYGDSYTVMGANYSVSGEYVGQHKATLLGWLPFGAFEEVSSSGNYSLAPLENPGGVKTLRVTRNAATGAALWIEYRQPLGVVDTSFENFPAGQSNVYAGASIRYQDPDLDSLHTYLLDFKPIEVPNDFETSALLPGQSWSDPDSPLTIAALVANQTGMALRVSYDPTCATLALSSGNFPATGGSGTITVTAPSTCAWTATTADPWITINSGASGTGNGVVAFTLAPNHAASQQTGYVTVQRQSVALLQAGTGPVFVPAAGSSPVQGNAGKLAFTVDDARGLGDVSTVSVNFNDLANSGCSVLTYGAEYLGAFYLLSDDGARYLPFNGAASVSNSQCTLFADSTEAISGNTLTVSLHIQFANSVGGAHVAHVVVSSAAEGNVGPFNVGRWQVPFKGPVASLGNEFVTFGTVAVGADSPAQTVTLQNTGAAALSIGSVGFTGANPGQFNQTNTCGTKLAAGATCTFSIHFAPTVSGPLSATMTLGDSANGAPHAVMLTGSGEYTLSPAVSSVAFQDQLLGTTSPGASVVITNIGSTPLKLASIALTGANVGSFSQTNNCPAQLAAGASCTIVVTFKPTASGVDSAALTLSYVPSGTVAFPVTVNLGGDGVTTVTPPQFSLDSGTFDGAQTVTISDATAQSTIYYTTNGATPTTASTKYTGPITLTKTTQLKAIAVVAGAPPSAVASGEFTIVNPVATAATLAVTPAAGSLGAVYTLKATVTAAGAPVSAGSVGFYEDGLLLEVVPIVAKTGAAILKTTSLLPGKHAVTARFIGDNLDQNAASKAVNVTVTPAYRPSGVLRSAGTQGDYTLTANFTADGAGVPGGAITFNDLSTGTVLGTVAPSDVDTAFSGTTELYPASGIHDIVTGDVNGDGYLDLVFASYNGSTNWISIALGHGDGTFGAPQPVVTLAGDSNGGPAVALADVNGDGKLDILAASWAGYGVAVFLGQGNGTFGPEADFPVSSGYANSIATGDFNGDGKIDIVTSDPFGSTVSVLLGKGNGAFAAPLPLTTDTSPEAVVVADFDHDGKLDIAASNTTGTVSIFLGNGDGTFRTQPLVSVSASGHYQGSRGITAADFNGDGVVDLALGIWDSESVGLLFGNGDGTFQTVRLLSTPNATPSGIVTADINRDGHADIVVVNYNGSVASVLLGAGDGTFDVKQVAVDDGSASVAVGDFNGDSLLDLATVSSTLGSTSVRLAQTLFDGSISPVDLPGLKNDQVDAVYTGAGNFQASTTNTLTLASNASAAAVPVFKPAGGTFTAAQTVAISDSTPGALIHYTVDGTTPTAASALYESPITVSKSETIKAIAVASGDANSAVATAKYTINP
jgi:M6 family metalloprotease-like protein